MSDAERSGRRPRRQGLYCPPGDFYIDPWRPVERAVITHAHADHARVGHGALPRQPRRPPACCARGWGDITLQTLRLRRTVIEHHGVRLSLHPAGHVLGSAQVRHRAPRPGLGRLGRLFRQRRRRRRGESDLRPVRAGALRLLHHREHLRPADLSLAAAGRRSLPRSTPGGRPMPRPAAPACCSPTASARRSASSPASMRRSGRSSCMARCETLNQAYRAAGVALPPTQLLGRYRRRRRCGARW